MCGRYVFAKKRKELLSRYGLGKEFDQHGRSMPELPLFNVTPSTFMPVVVLENGEREWVAMHWGFIPFWSQDGRMVPGTNNARSESVAASRLFKDSFAKRRCLVPVTGFYEWKTEGKNKLPSYIHLRGEDIFSFAGIWTLWQAKGQAHVVPSFSIITIGANEFMEPIHERMPVILSRDEEDRWLDPATSLDEVKAMMRKCPSEKMTAHRVSKAVNKAGIEGEELIKPITEPESTPASKSIPKPKSNAESTSGEQTELF